MNVIAEFSDKNGLNVKLTEDKLFVTSTGVEETFALRGLNGIGVYDDIKQLNADLNYVNSLKKESRIWSWIIIFVMIFFLFGFNEYDKSERKAMIIAECVMGYLAYYFWTKHNKIKPELRSYLKIILTGGDRRFDFNKKNKNAKNIALFINKVEETLTAYHIK